MMWGDWGIHWIWMVVFWAAFIGLIVWAVTRLAPTGGDRDGDSARRILDERYARGEIDEDDYRHRRSELSR